MKKTENLLDKDSVWAKLCIQDLPDIEQGCHSLNQNVQLLLLSCHVLTAKRIGIAGTVTELLAE